jgi:hypothetical protein
VVKTSSIHHFSFLPALGLAQIFKSKQFLSVALVYDLSMSATALYRRAANVAKGESRVKTFMS